MNKTYFPEVADKIKFEGRDTDNLLAFRYYDAKRQVGGKTMAEHLRFAIAYWHTFASGGQDIFGLPTFSRPWHSATAAMDGARETLAAAFEFFGKLGVEYYCFHDRDIAPEGASFAESCQNLETLVPVWPGNCRRQPGSSCYGEQQTSSVTPAMPWGQPPTRMHMCSPTLPPR